MADPPTSTDDADDDGPRYGRGADLSQVPLAADVPRPNLRQLFGVDSANPIIRQARIEAGFLRREDVPEDLLGEELPPPHGDEDGE
jgi:hypothetical protein